MAYQCARCGASFDATLFQFGIAFRCDCGAIVRPEHVRPTDGQAERNEARRREEWAYRELQRRADRIAVLIVSSDYPRIDIELEMRELRRFCRRLFPDRMDLFRMVYQARLDRLWEQFRS